MGDKRVTRAVACLLVFLICVSGCGEERYDTDKQFDANEMHSSIEVTGDEKYDSEVEVDSITDREENLSESVETQNTVYESLWLGTMECKIVEYVGESDMIVKMPIGKYMIQCMLPISFAEKSCKSYGETNSASTGEGKAYSRIVTNTDQSFSFYVLILEGSMYDEFEYLRTNVENLWTSDSEYAFLDDFDAAYRDFYAYESPFNGTSTVVCSEVPTLEGEDTGSVLGYTSFFDNAEEKMFVMTGFGTSEEADIRSMKQYAESIVFREKNDSDFIVQTEYTDEEWEANIEALYQRYIAIEEDRDAMLQSYGAPYERYDSWYAWDITKDGVPEIVYLGHPHGMCIVGKDGVIWFPGDSIFFTDEAGVFVVAASAGSGCTEWYRCTLIEGAEGLRLEKENIMSEDFYYDNPYTRNGEQITEEEYRQFLGEVYSPMNPKVFCYNDDYVSFSIANFKAIVKRMSNNPVY